MQIRGRQILHVVRTFFEVKPGKRMQYELMAVINHEWAGDANLPSWKAHWDEMMRNMRSPISDDSKLEIFFNKIRDSSDLRSYVEHFDRLADDHPDKSYQWLSNSVDKVIRDKRNRTNTQALSAGTLFDKKGRRPGAPGPLQDTPAEQQPKGDNTKGDPKGKGKGKEGKGGAKGDPKGKGKGNGKKSPGFAKNPERSCFQHFFAQCDPTIKKGKCCQQGFHRDEPSEAERENPFFKRLEAQYGEWSKGRFKYNKTAAPAKQQPQQGNAQDTPTNSPRGPAGAPAPAIP